MALRKPMFMGEWGVIGGGGGEKGEGDNCGRGWGGAEEWGGWLPYGAEEAHIMDGGLGFGMVTEREAEEWGGEGLEGLCSSGGWLGVGGLMGEEGVCMLAVVGPLTTSLSGWYMLL